MIEYNLTFSRPNVTNSYYSIAYLALTKAVRNRYFILVPDELHLDDRGNLHNDSGPAIVFDSFKFHFLHGLTLEGEDAKRWIYRDLKNIRPQEILQISNVDLRREVIRKVGIELVLDGLFHRVLDKQGDYTLLQVLLQANPWSACNFLKMLNPSIGCWHMEGVPNHLRTVEEALLWRNNGWFAHAEKIT
jgi:hypothetical protein